MKKRVCLRYVCILLLLLSMIGLELKQLDSGNKSSDRRIVTDEFSFSMNLVDVIFSEIKCFPVMNENEDVNPVTYTNSWGAERTYGGERVHEGCDLMPVVNERGKYRVCSMTDGIVKNIGWLEQGGWRIGIESNSGIYYYYAHLDSYEKAFQIGERVAAGQILGRMGDSGYGKKPDTKGKFDVHLHVGIYVKDKEGTERAVNPYWYLKQLEK